MTALMFGPHERLVELSVAGGVLGGRLYLPTEPRAAVIVAQPSSIGWLSRRERFVAVTLARVGFATLLVDLLTEDEDGVRSGAHDDVPLLADRLCRAAAWLEGQPELADLPMGWLGAGAAAAAALVVGALEPDRVRALVSRGGRPELAGAATLLARVPTLFLVAGHDTEALASTCAACSAQPRRHVECVRSASGTLVEDEAVDRVAALSAAWFSRWLDPSVSAGQA